MDSEVSGCLLSLGGFLGGSLASHLRSVRLPPLLFVRFEVEASSDTLSARQAADPFSW